MLLERIIPEEGVDEDEDQEVEDIVEVKAKVKEEAMEKTKDERMVEEMTKAKETVDAGISRIKSKTIPKRSANSPISNAITPAKPVISNAIVW